MAPDITFRAAPPANFVAHGLEETVRLVTDLLDHWSVRFHPSWVTADTSS
jgi:hypothetical protein